MDWSNDKTVSFIEYYRSNEILWNHQLSDFKNNRRKLDIFQKLSKKFECDIPTLKRKIKNLRTQFHREHKAITKTVSGQSPIKKIKWCYYDGLSFLLDVDLPRQGTSTHDESDEIDEIEVRKNHLVYDTYNNIVILRNEYVVWLFL